MKFYNLARWTYQTLLVKWIATCWFHCSTQTSNQRGTVSFAMRPGATNLSRGLDLDKWNRNLKLISEPSKSHLISMVQQMSSTWCNKVILALSSISTSRDSRHLGWMIWDVWGKLWIILALRGLRWKHMTRDTLFINRQPLCPVFVLDPKDVPRKYEWKSLDV